MNQLSWTKKKKKTGRAKKKKGRWGAMREGNISLPNYLSDWVTTTKSLQFRFGMKSALRRKVEQNKKKKKSFALMDLLSKTSSKSGPGMNYWVMSLLVVFLIVAIIMEVVVVAVAVAAVLLILLFIPFKTFQITSFFDCILRFVYILHLLSFEFQKLARYLNHPIIFKNIFSA